MDLNQHTNSYDPIKNKSEAFLDMKALVIQLMHDNPELTQTAIHDRNILIKSLNAEIDHRKTTYAEIESRYHKLCEENKILKEENVQLKTELNKLKFETQNFISIKQQLESSKFEISSKDTTNKLLLSKIDKLNDQLTDQSTRLEESKIHLAVEKKVNEKTLSFKLEKLAKHIPGWPGKILCSILSSSWVMYALLFMIFAILFIASIVGWGPIATTFAPFYTIFFKG